jgi:hypothetical protein
MNDDDDYLGFSQSLQKERIRENQRVCKYERILRRIRQRVVEYEEHGKLDKAHRAIARIKIICGPAWERRARRQEEKQLSGLRWQ